VAVKRAVVPRASAEWPSAVRRISLVGAVCFLLSTLSCTESVNTANTDDADPANADGDDDEATPDEEPSDASTRDGGKQTSSDGGTPKPGNAPSAQKDSGTAKPGADAGATGAADAALADAGSAPAQDGGSVPGPGPEEIPAPMAAPMVWGFGIGITDVPGAVKFYTEVMKMTVEKEGIKRAETTETILYGAQAKRGAHLLLMNFDDQRNTRKITAKLVFQASNTRAVNTAAAKYPDYVSRLNFGIVQFDGPETYVHEVGGSFDSSASAGSDPYPIAMGFAVSDMAASRKFYTALGMEDSSLGTFSVTDVNGSASITEYTVKFKEGTGVVLQQWSTTRNAKNNPIKVVMFVPDAKAIADKVVAAGGSIAKEAERIPAYDNRLVIVAKDLDGYTLDLVQ